MKKLVLLAGALLVVNQAGVVSAKSLEDVLKEKGVITDEDYKEIVKSSPIKYKLGEGFNFTSATASSAVPSVPAFRSAIP